MSQGGPKDVHEKRPDVLRASPYGPISKTKGRIRNEKSSERTTYVNSTIIHNMVFMKFFLYLLIPTVYHTLHCQRKLK